MKIARLPIQIISILLQVYFFIETIRLHTVENTWSGMLFTLVVVAGCEVLSFVESILFVISKHNFHSFLYLAAVVVNAMLFMNLAYYTEMGTVVCIVSYSLLFAFRIINLVTNITQIANKR